MYRDMRQLAERLERPPRVYCAAAGCGRRTNDRKPFCSDHVTLQPYVQRVLAELERERAEDLAAASSASAPDLSSSTAREIETYLDQRGPTSAANLSARLSIPQPVVVAYAQALVGSGRLVSERTKKTVLYACVVSAELRETA